MFPPEVERSMKQFLLRLRRRQFEYSNEKACETVKLLEKVVANSEWETAKDVMDIVRVTGEKLADQPFHSIVRNMVRRVLKIIRDEYNSALGREDECDRPASLQKIMPSDDQVDYAKKIDALKKSIAANLRELMEELERSPENIAGQALEYIHSDDVIMTMGYSRTVEIFLKKAASERNIQVYVAEAEPSLSGHKLAKNLAESGIQTILICDAAKAALMPRINKVIVGAHSVMPNGALKALSGVNPLAAAANYHSVPVFVLAPVYKLTPEYSTPDQEGFNHMRSPAELIPFSDADLLSKVEVLNPAYDYVSAELVTLIITNRGGNAPSYVYRLLSELYHPDDLESLD